MQNKWRFSLGLIIFALLFFYFGVRVYFVFIHQSSSDGWAARQQAADNRWHITYVEPNGPATALQTGDEVLALNGIPPTKDSDLGNFGLRVPPGTTYQMTIRRNGQELVIPLQTVAIRQDLNKFLERAYVFINAIFVLTGFIVFLLKPDNQQAWLLALTLGMFIGLNTWIMPVEKFGRGMEVLVGAIKIMQLWTVPLLLRFFLHFPEDSPLLGRWPKLGKYLEWPFYLMILPVFGGARLPTFLKQPYFQLPVTHWFDEHDWFYLPQIGLVLYLLATLLCLLINYRAARPDARRRLRVVLGGSGLYIILLVLVLLLNFSGQNNRAPKLEIVLQIGLIATAPLIPLSFAYAIIRHKVIPISLIIRRGLRYLLVSRGSMLLVMIGVGTVGWFLLDALFRNFDINNGRIVGTFSAIVAILGWHYTWALHQRLIAPAIDRRFFRQAYDAQQIMAELGDSLRSTTNRAELLELGATKIQSALQTEHVTILLPDEATKEYRSAYSHSHNGTPDIRLAHNDAIVQRLQESNQPLELDEETTTLPASLLLPLKGKDTLSGIVALGARRGDLPFSQEDKQLLLSVGAPMSFALENTRLIEQMIEDARRREELEAQNEQRAKELAEARQLQLSMLPKRVPDLPHFEIAAYMKTATEVGGDYYDFHVAADDTLTIAVGDATGHGLKAGTVVTAMKGLFLTHAPSGEVLAVLTQSSQALKAMNLRSLFMALTLVKLRGHEMQIASAGMPPALIYHANTNTVEEVLMKTMPLGSLRNYAYRDAQFTLQSGDVVVMLSDGFPERFNAEGEMLGFDKAQEVLQATAHLSAQEIVEQFTHVEEQWAQGFAQNDDVTFVVLKVK